MNVLMIEDSDNDAALILHALSHGGSKVKHTRVSTANQLESVLMTQPWDVIISDFAMPQFNGLEAFDIYKKSGLNIPFFLVSGTIGEEVAVEAMKKGVSDYIMKNNLTRLLPSVEKEIKDIKNRLLIEEERRQIAAKERAAIEMAFNVGKIKSEFLANTSHELRTPLNVAMGMIEVLTETPLNKEQTEILNTIQNSCSTLLKVINDILDFSDIESGKMNLTTEKFAVSSLVKKLVEQFTHQTKSKKLQLRVQIADDIPEYLEGDPTRIEQVFINLLSNAIKFTKQGEIWIKVNLETKESKPWVRFSVVDTGIGIAEEDQARLFQAFTQADGSMTRKYGGAGLGLAICKLLVELMGGQIGLQSALGQGSTFWFLLPKTLPRTNQTNNK